MPPPRPMSPPFSHAAYACWARVAASRPAVKWVRAACSKRRSEEHTSELQSLTNIVCRLLLENEKWFLQNEKTVTQFCRKLAAERPLKHIRDEYNFFFNDTATTEIYTLSLHDALPISSVTRHTRAGPG